jgi:glycosyltransferase involved in cell wall biosynthesis
VDGGVSSGRVVLQGLGVDRHRSTGGDRARARATWGVDADTVVIGHLGNNSAEKGTIDLLLAADLLWQRGLPFHVVLAGPEMPNFQAFCRAREFGGPVTRLGRLSEDQKRDSFAGIDVFALPSRSDSFGLVLLEAWANNVPNVAYRAGGIADLICHASDGLLVGAGDIVALADALRQLVADPVRRNMLGARGNARLEAECNWEDKLGLVGEVYHYLSPSARLCSVPASNCGS